MSVDEDYELLKTRTINPTYIYDKEWLTGKICVKDNNLRELLNKQLLELRIQNNNLFQYKIHAVDVYSKKCEDMAMKKHASIYNKIKTMNEAQTGRLMTILPLIENETYVLTTNLCTEYGFVNSAEVVLISICIDETLDQISQLDSKNTLFQMPKYILVKLKTQSNSNIIQLDNLPPGVFYIKPHKESFT